MCSRLNVDSLHNGKTAQNEPTKGMVMQKRRFHFGNTDGAAALEFALLTPALVAMLVGIVSYGGYFWLSHSVQQSANDGARAAIGGLNKAERAELAKSSVIGGLPAYAILDAKAVSVVVTEDSERMVVTVKYDASGTPFWVFQKILPMPSSTIASNAVVRLGGY